MTGKAFRQTSKGFIYLVTIVMGIAFTLTLLSIARSNALDFNRREFQLQSVSIKESVLRNVTAADNAIHGIAAYFLSNPEMTQPQFNLVGEELLRQHSYIKGVVYARPPKQDVRNETTPDSDLEIKSIPVSYLLSRSADENIYVGYDLYTKIKK